MKKKLLLLVALLAALTGANAQTFDTLHVTGGDTYYTTEEVPINGYFADYGFHTEMIYPAWQVDTMAGNALMGFTFYTGGSSANANVSFSETCYLYLEEVSATGYGNQFRMSDQAQLVWTGAVTITGGRWDITFDTPYEYNGGNLLVTVLCYGQTGGSYSHVYFNAYTLPDASLHPSAYGRASSNHQMPSSAGASIYLPEVSMAYSSDVCPRPQGLMVDSVGTNTAALHWDTVSGATAYEWKLLAGDTVADSGITVLPSLTLGSLVPSTTYQLRVRTICSSPNAVNLYSHYSFTTACGTLTAVDLPYIEDFESYDNLATSIPCWTMLAYSRPDLLRVESATYGSDTSKVLSLWPDSNSLPQFAVMPRMENIADLHLTFRMHSMGGVYGPLGILQVGVMTNAVDTLTFTPMAVFETVGWQELEVDFDAFTGTSGHIAFRAGMPPTQRRAYVEIDDIVVTMDSLSPEPPQPREPFKYWVSFTDKQGSSYSLANPSAYLSQRALERRSRKGVRVDSLDLPVNPAYVQAVRNAGADVRYTSRWLNGLMAYLPADQSADSIAALPFVAEVTCIDSIGACEVPRAMRVGADTTTFDWVDPYSEEWYGYSYTQMKMHNAAAMHSAGYTGQGVLIGVMDGGYHSVDTNSVMRRAREEGRIVATRNFVEPSMSVYEDTLIHGSNVLHFMGAYAPGYVMGTAMDAQFALCVTEDSYIENVTEEYHMAAALEFLDSLGADIVNASLNYSVFVPYEHCDGQTEVASIVGNIAAAKGMAFVVSAGNSGHLSDYYIAVPADAEYVFTVGAVAADSTAAYFTSRGPTADGRTKPDAASYGYSVTLAQYDGRFTVGSGTSYATPILCGLMACVLQQHPEYTPYQLYDTIRSWGHMADNPNNTLGYGIPDFSRSLHNPAGISDLESQTSTLCIYPNPAADRLTVSGLGGEATLQILDVYGRVIGTVKATRGCTIDVSALSPGTYLICTTGERSIGTAKFIKR